MQRAKLPNYNLKHHHQQMYGPRESWPNLLSSPTTPCFFFCRSEGSVSLLRLGIYITTFRQIDGLTDSLENRQDKSTLHTTLDRLLNTH